MGMGVSGDCFGLIVVAVIVVVTAVNATLAAAIVVVVACVVTAAGGSCRRRRSRRRRFGRCFCMTVLLIIHFENIGIHVSVVKQAIEFGICHVLDFLQFFGA